MVSPDLRTFGNVPKESRSLVAVTMLVVNEQCKLSRVRDGIGR